MSVKSNLIYKVLFLSLLAHQSFGWAQPLELVTLSDKGGLLPPEDKSTKEDAAKSALAKSLASATKVSAVAGAKEGLSGPGAAKGSLKSSYVVKKGDTLEKVIAQNFSDSPIKAEILRKELMALNPTAFSKGNPKMLLAGSTLKLPQQESILNKKPGNASGTWSNDKTNLVLSGYTSYPPAYASAESSEKRRRWVQYP